MSPEPNQPAPRRILGATALAILVAAVILASVVLPAEYGIDPLGTGQALGLTALAGVTAEATATSTPTPPASPAKFQQDTYTVELRPFEGVEYKYRLEKDAAIVYSWQASASVGFEFHGEPDGAPRKYFDSYSKGDGAEAHGGFVAAKPGIHGWFWENKTAARITVTLQSSGFYSASTEYRDGERINRTFGTSASK